ncbi:membrane protein TVP23 [Seminavis robusta]|uniref:Golgi apparatus membrane protein TVP23 homolog n=1 Tax=Seminavis robusta TaxID=568900 RepID=A0A9N8HZL3_9STRA|nr:membrane protein TVP23 [Seminavis robusta]|eukprot:Sro2975_g341340.1 membrane protein TVP23 (253) ;mRNA; r:4870-5628
MASHDLSFDVSHNGVAQPPSHDQMAMSGQMDAGNGMGGTGGSGMLDRLKTESAHPTVCIFHCLFKAVAMFLYIFGGWFTGNGQGGTSGSKFIMLAVLCILLLAADFWVVKNITGRLLVGLRWWNKVEGDTTRWIFECADTLPNGSTIQRNKFDSNVFWMVLYVTPVIWGGLFIIGLLKFELGWLILVVMALGLNCANVYGYYKCSNDQKAKFQQMMQQGAQQGALAMVRSSVLGALTGTPANGAASPSNTYV